MGRLLIEQESGYIYTFIEVPDVQAIYESIRDQIQQRSHIEYESADYMLEEHDEGCTFENTDWTINVYKSTKEIYINAY